MTPRERMSRLAGPPAGQTTGAGLRVRDDSPVRLVPGPAPDPTLIPATLWDAFERAATTAIPWSESGTGGRGSARAGLLAEIRSAVREVAAGVEPELAAVVAVPGVAKALDGIRRELLREAHPADGLDAVHLLRLVSAVDRVQELIELESAGGPADGLPHPIARDLLIEVAHDMRSPLSAILILVDALRGGRSGPVTQLQERQLGLVYGAAFGLSQVATDLIDLARGGERLVDHRPVPFSVSELLQALRAIVQPIAEEKGLVIHTSGPAEDGRMGYPAALTRVLLNLATNALKFTSEGSVTIGVNELSRTRLEFSVRDTGQGIPGDVLEGLFQPFRRRADSDRYAFSNAGLGLIICRRLVRLMGSELQVSTSPAQGTRFHFEVELPIADQARTAR